MPLRSWKPLALGITVVLAGAGPALAVPTETLRLDFGETVTNGQYAQGQAVVDGIAPNEDGTVDLVGTAPGFVTQVASPVGGSGTAMQFGTTSCSATACSQLGHLEIPDGTAAFSPRSGDFEWGAVVQMTALPTGPGMNVVQKGRSRTPDMWKLQLDGGYASCIVKVNGATPSGFGRAVSSQLSVGRAYDLRCRRAGGALTLTVTELSSDGTRLHQDVYSKTSGVSGGSLDDFGHANAVFVGGKGRSSRPDQLRDTILDTVTYGSG